MQAIEDAISGPATVLAESKLVLAAEPPNKPAILLTGAHHARELITIQMVLFQAVKFLHGILHHNTEQLSMLNKNNYYFIPVVNPDGLNIIEQDYNLNPNLNFITDKRKNMGPAGSDAKWECS